MSCIKDDEMRSSVIPLPGAHQFRCFRIAAPFSSRQRVSSSSCQWLLPSSTYRTRIRVASTLVTHPAYHSHSVVDDATPEVSPSSLTAHITETSIPTVGVCGLIAGP